VHIREEARNIPVIQDCDVCVLGGSCTGVFAAVRAAQMGATVALVEKQNAFGGVATSSPVRGSDCLIAKAPPVKKARFQERVQK
jgi:pyruvate/2-oxoglutarate dehydrogenase complex dihydrolipoamide dehydrogenase (E3) component